MFQICSLILITTIIIIINSLRISNPSCPPFSTPPLTLSLLLPLTHSLSLHSFYGYYSYHCCCDTSGYVAPEILEGKKYGKKTHFHYDFNYNDNEFSNHNYHLDSYDNHVSVCVCVRQGSGHVECRSHHLYLTWRLSAFPR